MFKNFTKGSSNIEKQLPNKLQKTVRPFRRYLGKNISLKMLLSKYLQFMHLKPKNVTIISNTERIVHMEYNMFKVQKNMKNTVQMITKGPLS